MISRWKHVQSLDQSVKKPRISKLETSDHQHLPKNTKISILDGLWITGEEEDTNGCRKSLFYLFFCFPFEVMCNLFIILFFFN